MFAFVSGFLHSALDVKLLLPVLLVHSSSLLPGEGKNYPLQYSGLENYMDCTAHGVTKSWT